ncbi:MAG TPA: YhbY family RNA-binding protein [Gammaproteobacteria bacterium]|nr:YhbY family RNA-binding protein [Gammaproteobacteria bacterium]
MQLTSRHIKLLKKLGHSLNPVIMIADQGVKASIIEATGEALRAHELIKVKIRSEDRSSRDRLLQDLCEKTGATLISQIGFTALLFKRNPPNPRIDFKAQP